LNVYNPLTCYLLKHCNKLGYCLLLIALAIGLIIIGTTTGFIQQSLIQQLAIQNLAVMLIRLTIETLVTLTLRILPMPYIVVVLSLSILSIIALSFGYKVREEKLGYDKKETSSKMLQIGLDYFNGKDFDAARRYVWSVFAANQRSHSKHLLTMVVAILALAGAWATFPGNPIILIFMVIVPATALFWIWLRSKYWSIWVNCAMLMTQKEIVDNFNICNLRDKYYEYYQTPCCESVIHIAIKQKVIAHRDDFKWNAKESVSKFAIFTGLKKETSPKAE
jgi:hypothetical protein